MVESRNLTLLIHLRHGWICEFSDSSDKFTTQIQIEYNQSF